MPQVREELFPLHRETRPDRHRAPTRCSLLFLLLCDDWRLRRRGRPFGDGRDAGTRIGIGIDLNEK